MAKSDEILFDLRTYDINLKWGKLNRAQIDKHLKELPDDSNSAQDIIVYDADDQTEAASEGTSES